MEASGRIRLFGCAKVILSKYYSLTFPINSIVYIVYQAQKGELEKICVKRVNMIEEGIFNYVDTFNRVWLEGELCEEEEAIELYNYYYENTQRHCINATQTRIVVI